MKTKQDPDPIIRNQKATKELQNLIRDLRQSSRTVYEKVRTVSEGLRELNDTVAIRDSKVAEFLGEMDREKVDMIKKQRKGLPAHRFFIEDNVKELKEGCKVNLMYDTIKGSKIVGVLYLSEKELTELEEILTYTINGSRSLPIREAITGTQNNDLKL